MFQFLKILPYTGVCPYDCAYCWFKDPVLIPASMSASSKRFR